ncbi:MAG: phosphotransferase [Verrucomicrobiota bacterium]
MKTALRGFAPDLILENIGRVEHLLGLSNTKAEKTYHQLDYWLVQPGYLKTCFRSLGKTDSPVIIPWFSMPPWTNALGKVLKRYKFFTRIRGKANADVICVKNNIRSFYINRSQPVTLKILLSKTRNASHLSNDVSIRQRMGKFETLNIPRILEHNLDFDPPFLCEELIIGRRLHRHKDAAQIVNQLCLPLWQTYEKHGIDLKNLHDLVDLPNAKQILTELCAAHRWDNRWLNRASFVEQTINFLGNGGLVTCSVGHGDLGLANLMMSNDGRVFVLDWECAKPMPIASDVLELALTVPETKKIFTEKLNQFATQRGEPAVLCGRAQFFFAIAEYLLRYGSTKRLQKPRKFMAHFDLADRLLRQGLKSSANVLAG